MGRVDVGAVGGDERPDAAGDAAGAVGVAGRLRLGQGSRVQGLEAVLHPGADQPVAVDGVGVGRGDGGARGEVVRVDLRAPARDGRIITCVDQSGVG